MKRMLKILGRVALGLLVAVYVLVALLNYSVVQSLAGAVAGAKMSQLSGGTVRVGSISANLLDHIVIHDALIATPEGDTCAYIERTAVRFKGNPVMENGIRFGRVSVRNGEYHLLVDSAGINLRFFIQVFNSSGQKKEKGEPKPFELQINTIVLHNLRYHHDLLKDGGLTQKELDALRAADPEGFPQGNGADIPHLDFRKVSGRFTGFCVDELGRVTLTMHHFECEERNGLQVQELQGDVDVGPKGIYVNNLFLTTATSHMEADVALRFSDWKVTKYWCDSVDMYVLLKPGTELSMADAAYWAPVLWGMDTKACITGLVTGPVADMHCHNMAVRFGNATSLMFDGSVVGLPWIERTVFDVAVERLSTNYADLCAVRHPDDRPPVKVLPILKPMGQVDVVASFRGLISNFHARAAVHSAVGQVMAEVHMAQDRERVYSYRGEVSSPSLRIALLARNEWVSSSGFSLHFDGKDFNPKRMVATIDGNLYNTVLKGTPLAEATIDARMRRGVADLTLGVADTLLRLDVKAMANITSQRPFCRLDASLAHADMVGLHLANGERDSLFTLSTMLQAEGQMDLDRERPMESLDMDLRLSDTRLCRNQKETTIHSVTFTAQETRSQRKRVTLRSDLMDGDVRGYFSYSALPLVVRRFCDQYVPVYFNPYADRADEEVDYTPISDADMNLSFTWNDAEHCAAVLLPGLEIAAGTRVSCTYGFAQSLKLLAKSDSLRLGGMALYDWDLDGQEVSGRYILNLKSDNLSLGAIPLLDQFKVQLTATPSRASCGLHWFDQMSADTTRGDVQLVMNSTRDSNLISVARNRVIIHGNRWRIETARDVLLARQCLLIEGLRLMGRDQALAFSARIHGDGSDSIAADFQNFDLSSVDFLLSNIGFSLEGKTHGHFHVYGLGGVPLLDADLAIKGLGVNDQLLGNARLLADWDADSSRLGLSMVTDLFTEAGHRQPLSAVGYLEMDKKEPEMHFNVGFTRFSLAALAPLVRGFSSMLEGDLDGRLQVEGPLSRPQVEGGLRIRGGQMQVDATHITYTINDSLTLTPESILFHDFAIHDPHGDSALLNGAIRHKGFRDISLDLGLSTQNLWILNTFGGAFYGNISASADGRIRGSLSDLDIAVDAVTRPGSHIFVPINSKRQVEEASYIRFGEDDLFFDNEEEVYHPEEEQGASAMNYHITVNLSVTPDVNVSIPVEYSPVRADLAATGQGDLLLSLQPGSPLSILGAYEIGTGSLKLNLAGIVSRDFTIDPGSNISFMGSAADSRFNIDAAYATRANLATLTGVSSSSDHTSQTITVEDVITLSGSLASPQIGFDIRLPNADQSVEEEVFSYIDRNNERDMLNQSLSLLVSGSFYNSANSTSLGNSSYSLLANTLGSVVSGMVNFVDINFDYSAATELSRQQFDVDINKDFGRFYLESTLGIGEASTMEGTTNDNQITGDVLVGYKLRPNIHFFVFNRSNTNDYTRSDMPYKQGMGIKLTKDFDNMRDLLGLKKKKKK